MRALFRHAHIGVAVAVVVAVLGLIFFNGNEDLMSAVGAGAFASAMGVYLFLNERYYRARAARLESNPNLN